VSLESVCGASQLTGSLIVSAPDVVTVTLLTYQPLEPVVPTVTASAALGAVLSSFTVSGAASVESPAPLVHEPVNVVPVLSVASD
jgi:uncharacterized protein involved in exopolysaccharide biosynthesis